MLSTATTRRLGLTAARRLPSSSPQLFLVSPHARGYASKFSLFGKKKKPDEPAKSEPAKDDPSSAEAKEHDHILDAELIQKREDPSISTPGTPLKDRPSFQAQLLNSTAQRVKAQREQYHEWQILGEKENQRPGGENSRRNFSTAASMIIFSVFFYLYGEAQYYPPSEIPESTSPLDRHLTPPKHKIARGHLESAWAEFVDLLGEENVSTNIDDLKQHATSPWSSHHGETKGVFMVLYPGSTEDVSGLMKICHRRRIPVTPYSGGTSLEGHFAPTRGGVCVDFSRMDKIVALHADDLDVVVQPAVGWENLNEFLEPHNLFFPPDPGPGAMIGGMVGTGCSGTNAARYGTMREWVLSLTVVLADGTIIKTRQRPRKSSAGYDLTKLFIGSEGTLGLVTEATLKLHSIPPYTSVAVTSFPNIKSAAQTVSAAAKQGLQLAAIELLDDVQMKCINASGSTHRTWREQPTLFLKFSGTKAGVKEQIAMFQKLAKKHGSDSFTFAANEEEKKDLWSARKEALWSVMALKRRDTDVVWTTDVAVPLSRLPEIIEETKADMVKSGLLGAIVGHVGDGNFHAIVLFDEERERKLVEGVVGRMVKRAVEMEGTVTGEHGVGLVKRDYLEEELGKRTVDAMRQIKRALDPGCLLNCDKVVRMQLGK